MTPRLVPAVLLVVGLFGAPIAMAQDDPADLGLWDMVQKDNTPSAYEVYLQAYPNGKFAPLARLRAHGGSPVQPNPVVQPGPTPQPPAPDPDSDVPQFTVTPMVARVGQRFVINCGTIPTGGRFDAIIAVPAGSPPNAQTQGRQGVGMDYVANCQSPTSDGTMSLGPLPPGRWEFRWITTLYNLENRTEVKATVSVVVR